MNSWQDIVRAPARGDHMVQVYQDRDFLATALAEYVGTGLRQGEAAIIIARPEHVRAFRHALWERDVDVEAAVGRGQLVFRDAQATLDLFMRDGVPQWTPFQDAIGGAIAGLAQTYPVVRAYGEMVDILWQNGDRDTAIRLEEFWNDLAKVHTFSLLCAYYLDNLDERAYGALQCVCKVHTHLIPARDYHRFDDAVAKAAEKVLDQPMMRMLLSMSSIEKPPAHMPLGQAMLFWMQEHMPATARKVLAEVRAQS